MGRPGFPVERCRVAFGAIPEALAVTTAQLCRWATSSDAVVLDARGRPYELVDLAAAALGDLADATLVIYSRALAAAFMGVPGPAAAAVTTEASGRRLARTVAYHRRRQEVVTDPAMVAYHRGQADGAEALLAERQCCRNCGCVLEDEDSKRRGYGSACWAERRRSGLA